MYAATASQTIDVLVVDDAPEFRQLLTAALTGNGYRVSSVADGETALAAMRVQEPDVVVLDLVMPWIDGVEVCRRLRTFSDVYVIMLTERAEEIDKLLGLAVGADDYLTKPCSVRELMARIGVLLRRPRSTSSQDPAAEVRHFGPLAIDGPGREVRVDGAVVHLTRIEFDLLETLARRPDMVYTRAMLVEQVWGPDWFGGDHLVSVHIANLRKKLGREGARQIRTVRGVGYRMAPSS